MRLTVAAAMEGCGVEWWMLGEGSQWKVGGARVYDKCAMDRGC